MIEFSDAVSYNRFVEDLAERIAATIKQALQEPEFVNQTKAYKMFGRANVDRWRRCGKLQPYKRIGVVEYRMLDLRTLQATMQDYLIR